MDLVRRAVETRQGTRGDGKLLDWDDDGACIRLSFAIATNETNAEGGLRVLMLIFANIDGLKQIHDTYGHGAGDEVVMEPAKLLRRTYCQADIIARLVGDEFTIFPLEASRTTADILV